MVAEVIYLHSNDFHKGEIFPLPSLVPSHFEFLVFCDVIAAIKRSFKEDSWYLLIYLYKFGPFFILFHAIKGMFAYWHLEGKYSNGPNILMSSYY